MLLMGKDYVDNNPVSLNDFYDGSLSEAYARYFKATNIGSYIIWSIGGGGGGSGDPFGFEGNYGRAGEHGDYGVYEAWIDRDTVVLDGSFRWLHIGDGGERNDNGGAAEDGGQTRIVIDTGFLALRSGGDGAPAGSSTNPSVTDAGTSPWTTAGLPGTSGRAGNGSQWSGGRTPSNGNSGAIRVKRNW